MARRVEPGEDFKRMLRTQVRMSRQVKLMGKHLLDLSQMMNKNYGRSGSMTPTDTSEGSAPVSEAPPSHAASLDSRGGQGIIALLVEGNYQSEWAALSSLLFNLGIAQASVAGDPAQVGASGAEALSRFDLVFMPIEMNPPLARSIQKHIRSVNYRAVFVAVTSGPAESENLRTDWEQWYSEVISARASMDQLNDLIHRHYQPLDSSSIISSIM